MFKPREDIPPPQFSTVSEAIALLLTSPEI